MGFLKKLFGSTSKTEDNSQLSTAEAYYEHAYTYIEKEEFKKAISDFTKAIELDPQFTASPSDLYREFSRWCEDNGHDTYPKKIFCQKMTGRFGATKVKYINGKSCRAYEGIGILTNNLLPYTLQIEVKK